MSKRLQEKAEKEATEKASRKFEWKWVTDGGIVYGDAGTKPSDKILALDMDGTIIKPKGKGKFAKDADDWVLLYDKVPPKLKEYHEKGYKIVIMTNQGGIEKGHTKLSDIKTKIENITEVFGVPVQALISPNKDYYHKPSPGMWAYMAKNLNGDKAIDVKQSYYVGDAAGRPKNGPRAADFDNTDYKFSLNCGVGFMTPEACFLGEKDNIPALDFNPKTVFKTTGNLFKGKTNPAIKKDGKEMIIFVGSPGSGKSTFWRNNLSDYVRVNNDTLKSKAKCMKVATEAMEAGKSLVIDNTNPEAATRKEYIDLAKKYNYPVRCFYFDVPKEIAFHLDDQREMNIHRKHESSRVGKLPIHTFYKKVEVPKKSEGFEEVETIEFVAGPFHSKDDEQMFYSYVSSKH